MFWSQQYNIKSTFCFNVSSFWSGAIVTKVSFLQLFHVKLVIFIFLFFLKHLRNYTQWLQWQLTCALALCSGLIMEYRKSKTRVSRCIDPYTSFSTFMSIADYLACTYIYRVARKRIGGWDEKEVRMCSYVIISFLIAIQNSHGIAKGFTSHG